MTRTKDKVLHKDVVTGAARSAAHVFKDPPAIIWKDMGGTIPQVRKNVGIPPRATAPVRIGTGPSDPPISIRSQDIKGPRRYIITQEVRNSEPLDASINIISSKHRYLTPIWSKVIGRKFTQKSRADVYKRSRMNLASDTVLSKSPNLMDLGCRPSKQQMNSGPSSTPLPELARGRMDTTGSRVAIVLVKLQPIERAVKIKSTTMILKVSLKLGETKW